MFEYSINNWEDKYPLETEWNIDCLNYIAEDAAQDYYNNCDKFVARWPIHVIIFHKGDRLKKFLVDMKHEPLFTAQGIK